MHKVTNHYAQTKAWTAEVTIAVSVGSNTYNLINNELAIIASLPIMTELMTLRHKSYNDYIDLICRIQKQTINMKIQI